KAPLAVGAGIVATAALVIAVALGSPESDPTAATPPAQAAPAPAEPKAKAAAPAAEPASPGRPPAAVSGYSDLGPGVLGTLEGSGAATGSGAGASARRSADGGSLPFTGLDLALLGLAGAALLGTGAALRRLASAPRL
ncbi:MAG TPA: hypothetical protein VFY44_06930, partial [Thermoleophilaceae bacterium]|nr:hypothetical protein [Thermoleophilaceae bacterium]